MSVLFTYPRFVISHTEGFLNLKCPLPKMQLLREGVLFLTMYSSGPFSNPISNPELQYPVRLPWT